MPNLDEIMDGILSAPSETTTAPEPVADEPETEVVEPDAGEDAEADESEGDDAAAETADVTTEDEGDDKAEGEAEPEEDEESDDEEIPKGDKDLVAKGEDGRMTIDKRQAARLTRIKNEVKELTGAETWQQVFESIDSLKALKPLMDQGVSSPERVQELVENAQQYEMVMGDFITPEPEAAVRMLQRLNEINPEAMRRMAAVMPLAMSKANPEAFGAIFNPIANHVVQTKINKFFDNFRDHHQKYEAARAQGQEQEARYHLEQAQNWGMAGRAMEFEAYGKVTEESELLRAKPKAPDKPDPRDQELEQLRQERQQRVGVEINGEIDRAYTAAMSAQDEQVNKFLEQFQGKVRPVVMDAWKTKITKAIEEDMAKHGASKIQLVSSQVAAIKTPEDAKQVSTTLVGTHATLVSESLRRLAHLRREFAKEASDASVAVIAKKKAVSAKKSPVASSQGTSQTAGNTANPKRIKGMDALIDQMFD